MNRSLNTRVTARTTLRRRLALAGAPIALLGLAAPMLGAGADPWWIRAGFGHSRGHDQVVIRTGPVCDQRQVIVREPVCVEVIPFDLHFSAYQSQGTVIVVATGSNRTGGFETCLTGRDIHDSTPTLILRNTAPGRGVCVTQAITCFSVSASFYSRCALSTVTVRVADTCVEVPVVQVRSLS